MIRLFINGLAASAGGGLTYLRNVIPYLARRVDAETTVLLSPAICHEFGKLPNISFVETSENSRVFRRFIREQTILPRLIRRSGTQVLISTGNFALWNSPVPQILLSRNSLYTSDDFSAMFALAETMRYGRILWSRVGWRGDPFSVPTLQSPLAKRLPVNYIGGVAGK